MDNEEDYSFYDDPLMGFDDLDDLDVDDLRQLAIDYIESSDREALIVTIHQMRTDYWYDDEFE